MTWFKREPDFLIGDPKDPYIRRWWIVRTKLLNIYLHNIRRDDDDRALHDHPWWNASIPLRGEITEVMPHTTRLMKPWRVYFRRATALHRLEVGSSQLSKRPPANCWTLFITGPRIRSWGFMCQQGWRLWRDFVDTRSKGQIGRGCGEMDTRLARPTDGGGE